MVVAAENQIEFLGRFELLGHQQVLLVVHMVERDHEVTSVTL